MDGRDGGFMVHGDNEHLNHTASDGCIILSHALREAIQQRGDKGLEVVA
jgi:lipoprotein-anchoring transpeptidase ErfK/SrfK